MRDMRNKLTEQNCINAVKPRYNAEKIGELHG